jgi:hypothetical protein
MYFIPSFPRKGSPVNGDNFYFRMKLYWKFLGTWACFHCADVLKWADIFMIWLQTLSCTWSSIWRLVQLSDWCASSWTDWLLQHKDKHSSLYFQDLNLESNLLLLSYSFFILIICGFVWIPVYKMSQYFTGILVLYHSHSINVTVQTLPISSEVGSVLVRWLWSYHIRGSHNVS